MFERLHHFLIILTVVAVWVMQAVGVQAGYLCGCTGEQASVATCVESTCHPRQAHADGCEDLCGHKHDAASATCGSHERGSGQPAQKDHEHKHTELRGTFDITTLPPSVSLPSVMCFGPPAVLQLPKPMHPMLEVEAASLPSRPHDNTGPPMALIVVETTELLV